jgi:hypothetical protein
LHFLLSKEQLSKWSWFNKEKKEKKGNGKLTNGWHEERR